MKKKSKGNGRSNKSAGKNDNIRTIQSILSCLFFLSKEAEKSRIFYVDTILKEAIAKIDLLGRGQSVFFQTTQIIDESLYEAMSFLHHLADVPMATRADFIEFYNELRTVIKNTSGKTGSAGITTTTIQ
jgi:hypothetical protein